MTRTCATRNLIFASLCLAALVSPGCSESQGYIDYTDLAPIETPEALPSSSEPMDDTVLAEVGTEPASVAPSESQPEKSEDEQPSPPETEAATTSENASTDKTVDATETETPTANSDDPSEAAPATSTEPREIKLLIADKTFRPEGKDSVRVSYDDIDLLKILNMEPVPVDAVKHFPDWLKSLDGTKIRIRGFMYPTFEATGLTGFTLARDNGICCFVRQPMIYDIIGVDMADGQTTDYIDNKPFDVEGVFQIEPEADDSELFQLYRITDAKVVK